MIWRPVSQSKEQQLMLPQTQSLAHTSLQKLSCLISVMWGLVHRSSDFVLRNAYKYDLGPEMHFHVFQSSLAPFWGETEWWFSGLELYKVRESCLWNVLKRQWLSLIQALSLFWLSPYPLSYSHALLPSTVCLCTLKTNGFKNASVAVNFACVWFYGFVELLKLN